MTQPPLRPDSSLDREFRSLRRTRPDEIRHRTISLARDHSSDALTQQARAGVEIVQLVARDLRAAQRPDEAEVARIAVTRTHEGRIWELFVVREGLPADRILARLGRSPKPPWRMHRVSYLTAPVDPE